MNLNQVTVPVTNLERAIAFYQKLGLQLIVHSNIMRVLSVRMAPLHSRFTW